MYALSKSRLPGSGSDYIVTDIECIFGSVIETVNVCIKIRFIGKREGASRIVGIRIGIYMITQQEFCYCRKLFNNDE